MRPFALWKSLLLAALLVFDSGFSGFSVAHAQGLGLDLTSDEPAPTPTKKKKKKKKHRKGKEAAEPAAAEAPAAEAPAAEAPAVEAPAAETPAAETPAAEAPTAEQPVAAEQPSTDQPAASGGFGLDLSDGPDLRPNLAIVGVALEEADDDEKDRAEKLGTALSVAAARTRQFKTVMSIADVATKLGDKLPTTLACREAFCLDEAAAALGVERVLVAALTTNGKNRQLTLFGLAAQGQMEEETAEASKSQLPKAAAQAAKTLFGRLSGLLANLKVVSPIPEAKVALSSKPIGTGSFEKPVVPGLYAVTVSAPGRHTYQTEVLLKPGETTSVEAVLQSMSDSGRGEGAVAQAQVHKSMWKRPGLYVSAAGLVAAGVGGVFGLGARSIEGKAKDGNGDGVLDITRVEANDAQSKATMANVFLGAGAALAVGGVVWALLDKTTTSNDPALMDDLRPVVTLTPQGVLVAVRFHR